MLRLRTKRDDGFRLTPAVIEETASVRLGRRGDSGPAGIIRRLLRLATGQANLWLNDEAPAFRRWPDCEGPAGVEL
jgi:hypothetical protein